MSDSSANASASSSNASDTTAYLRNASFSRNEGPSSVDAPVTASDLLNTNAFDPSRLHPMAAIGDKLDYLLLEDDKTSTLPGAGTPLPSRGWSDDLCYGTGTTYLAALIYNGINSSIDAWRGKHDQWGSMAAGGITGALFKSTAGVKPMVAAATLMTGLAGGWSWLKTVLL
ncbi:Mitochondrial import inner membrane translocase subunit tim23 [Tulasnella sp. UAMH 9824]|nr:Mitochondrial import inner membrane translocase subunit tim23 [Tulasnella sp. UAMH 9824]